MNIKILLKHFCPNSVLITDAGSQSILVHRIHTSTLLRGRKVKAVQKIVCSIHNRTTKEHPTHYLPLSLQLIDILYI